jgi:uncharacterized phage-like protein YoqJ
MCYNQNVDENIVAGTGHRPDHLGGYGQDIFDRLVKYAELILPTYHPTKVISGMALGWDQALALATLKHGIPLIASVPFEGQEKVWKKEQQELYHSILSKATEVVIVCPGGYASWKFIKRDQWMVDHSNAVLALWNGTEKGGTWQTVKYAKQVKRTLYNVWPGWAEENELFDERTD